ncbi:MAG: hypothetical protein ACK55O_15145 [Phycisphaerales bacterium]|jgi:hypothetical protein|nr:hypothetical protein [Phycisphaeraceae bacterium]
MQVSGVSPYGQIYQGMSIAEIQKSLTTGGLAQGQSVASVQSAINEGSFEYRAPDTVSLSKEALAMAGQIAAIPKGIKP